MFWKSAAFAQIEKGNRSRCAVAALSFHYRVSQEQHVFWWADQSKADMGWDEWDPGEVEPQHHPDAPHRPKYYIIQLIRPIFDGDNSGASAGWENSNSPRLRLICHLSANGGVPEDNDPSLCICLFDNLLQLTIAALKTFHTSSSEAFRQISSEFNWLEQQSLGNCSSIRLGAVGRKAGGNDWNSLALCNQCNRPL